MLSNVKILKKKFSFSSRNSRFWKKFSFTSRKNEILQTDSLSLLDSSLNVFSNSREKSYFALWVDFNHQCFAERESILKRQFCVVEQYSDFSLQKHFMETTTTKSLLWEYFKWLPSGKGICKTCKNEIVDWLGWRVRTRGGGEEIDFFIVFDIGYNKMDNYCTARLMIIALWWWYCQTHIFILDLSVKTPLVAKIWFCIFRTEEKKLKWEWWISLSRHKKFEISTSRSPLESWDLFAKFLFLFSKLEKIFLDFSSHLETGENV